MRKLLLILLQIVAICVQATPKSQVDAVSMVSYEQSWLDTEGTLALRNNTGEYIHSVTFRITYLDMKGNPLDYEEYSSEVEIAPKMTKKVDIPAYEHGRMYSYYKSEAYYQPHRFKIKFELTGYNTEIDSEADSLSEDDTLGDIDHEDGTSGSMFVLGFMLIAGVIGLGVYVGLYVLVAIMAKNRGRSSAGWVLVAVFTTPILAIIILLCIGKSYIPREEELQDGGGNDKWHER